MFDVALRLSPAAAGDEGVQSPAYGEPEQTRRGEKDHLRKEQANHLSRAKCAPCASAPF